MDTQYVTLSQQPDGSVLLIDWRQPPGSNHKVVRAAGDPTPLVIDLGDIDAVAGVGDLGKIPGNVATRWADALKISRLTNAIVSAGVVTSAPGGEDVLDMTASHNVHVTIKKALPNGQYVSTIKGGATDCSLTVLEQVGHGTVTDYDLGNWFDYGNATTRRIGLSVVVGSAPRCRMILADAPMVPVGQGWVISRPWWGRRWLFVLGKKLGLF